MEAINLSAFNLNTGKELLSFPLDYVEDDLAIKHIGKSITNPMSLTIECDNINNDILSKLTGKVPDKYDIALDVLVQRRKHKKKRINKKWAKRYGFKCVTKTTKGWKLKTYRDGSFEFIK